MAQTVPDAPTITQATAGVSSALIHFTAPASDGGALITNYEYSIDGGTTWIKRLPESTSSPMEINSLTNYREYSVMIRAVNSSGAGSASAATTVTPRNGQAAGIKWTGSDAPSNSFFSSVTYGNGRFVAVSESIVAITSTDGINWSTANAARATTWCSVTWGNGLFVAVSRAGFVMTSPNGTTWTLRTAAVNNAWRSITYGNGLFVAVSSTGSGNRVMTSPDGITWTSQSSAADNAWLSVTYANGLFVALADKGGTNAVMTSPDGINWTLQSNPTDGATNHQWFSVTYGNGLFAAVTPSTPFITDTDMVMTSPDGINWTLRNAPNINGWQAITYGNGLFVATSRTGNGNRVMTSPDGITWTSRNSTADLFWQTVTYGNGRFVAVAYNGTSTVGKVMTSSALFAPDKPVINSITAGTDNLSIDFTAPIDEGGSAISNYEYSTDNGATWVTLSPASITSPLTITGLSPSTEYQVKLRAVNAQGQGCESVATAATTTSNSFSMTFDILCPETTFNADPSSGFAFSEEQQAILAQVETALMGASPSESILYWFSSETATQENVVQDLTALQPGTYYLRFIEGGDFVNGRASAPITVTIFACESKVTVPDAPTSLEVTEKDGSIEISFTPGFDGGSAITNYEYTTDGGQTWTALSPADGTSPVTVPGLTNGTSYTVALRAVNAIGESVASASVTATPATIPSAPTNLLATPGNGELSISFTAGFDGGSAITNYEYTTDGGQTWTALSPADGTSPVKVPGLTNGTSYTVALRAINAIGKSVASASVTATPATVPSAPTNLLATPGNGELSISFTAGFDGGSAITNYEYTTDDGQTWTALSPADGTSPVTIPGLTNGTSYTVALRAVNAIGKSVASASVTATPVSPIKDWYVDADGDGYVGEAISQSERPAGGYLLDELAGANKQLGDCDDNKVAINPTTIWYLDADGDGYHKGNGITGCISPGANYISSTLGIDCNDADPNKRSTFGFYLDSDKDGYGSGKLINICAKDANTPPVGYSTNNTDCAPNDATKWRSALLYIDADNDGYTCGSVSVCFGNTIPKGYREVSNGMDCNDKNVNVNPGKTEVCGNKIDDDCDGQVDEGCVVACSFTTLTQTGWDATGASSPLTNSWFAAKFPSGLTIGGTGNSGRFVKLTSAAAVRTMLPTSGVANTLTQCWTNPSNAAIKNAFAGELVALTLNIALNPALGNARIKTGSYVNKTVSWLLAEGNLKISSTVSKSTELQALSDACSRVNSSFGKTKSGYVVCDSEISTGKISGRNFFTSSALIEKGAEEQKSEILVYPNPTSNHFNVKNDYSTAVQIRVLSLAGKVIEVVKRLDPGMIHTFGHNLIAGVYLLEVTENGNVTVRKIIKIG